MAVSAAVCEIFSVKEWCDLENRLGFVEGHWKWHHLIDRDEFLFAFHSNYGAILYRLHARYSDLLAENHKIFIPHLYLAPPQGRPRRNFVKMFDADKTRMIGLPYG